MKRLIIVVLAAIAISGCTGSSTEPSSGGLVQYQITGTAKHVALTYQNASGGTTQSGASLPWTYPFSAKSGDFLYVSAQIDTSPDAGNITISISKNGSIIQSASAFGFPNIATVSTSY
jgi:hypothetical protein